MRYFMVISYDGSKYYGFQRQNDLPSVQKEIEDKLSLLFGENVLTKVLEELTEEFMPKDNVYILMWVKKYLY